MIDKVGVLTFKLLAFVMPLYLFIYFRGLKAIVIVLKRKRGTKDKSPRRTATKATI